MSAQFINIPAKDLEIGMFVAELDRPWLETPFLVQGFVVSEPEQLKLLTELCDRVVIDSGKSSRHKARRKTRPGKSVGRGRLKKELANKRVSLYQDTRSFDQEIAVATKIYDDYEATVKSFYEDFRRNSTINLKDVSDTVNKLVNSIVRNPDACMLLRQMKRKSDYLHDHAMGMSIWAAALGRQLGLPPDDIKTIAMGALVADVGLVRISQELLQKPAKLTETEFSYVQTHVQKSLELAVETRGLSAEVLQVVASHHERFDGSGYPQGLRGTQIPLNARIVAIADCYDAVITNRPFANARSPSEAVNLLYQLRDRDFQLELVEEFIQTVGTYPVGTLVELSSGHLGTVMAEYRRRRLRPKVLLLTDANKKPVNSREYLDLLKVTHLPNGEPLEIVRALQPGAYDIAEDDIFA